MRSFTHYLVDALLSLSTRTSQRRAYHPNRRPVLLNLLLLACLLSAGSASAQYTFSNALSSYGSPGNINTLFASGTRSTPVLVDLNNDGKLDIVTGNTSGIFRYFQNNGTAKYSPATPGVASWTSAVSNPFSALSTTSKGGASTPTFVDIDADGDMDMFSGNGQGSFQFFRNNAGVFTEMTGVNNPLTYESLPANPGVFVSYNIGFNSTLGFIDVDGDDDFDVIAGNSQGGFFYFENTGDKYFAGFNAPVLLTAQAADGQLQPQQLQLIGAPTTNSNLSATVCIVDMNCDKIPDVLSGSRVGSFQFRTLNQAGPTFTSALLGSGYPLDGKDVSSNSSDFSYPAAGDLDGDGDVDFISGRSTSGFVVFQNTTCNTAPTFNPPTVCGSTINVDLDANGDTEHLLDPLVDFAVAPLVPTPCGNPAAMLFTPDVVTCANIGIPVQVVLQARDQVTGVKSSPTACIVNVLVNDATDPDAVCKPFYDVEVGNNNVSLGNVPVSAIENGSTDNCTATAALTKTLTYSYASTVPLSCANLGVTLYTITLNVTDQSGNADPSPCVTQVRVVDTKPPVKDLATLPALARETCDYSAGFFTPSIPLPSATDRCSGSASAVRVKVNNGPEAAASAGMDWDVAAIPAGFTAGTFTLTWIYSDATGNTSTQTQTLTITTPHLQFPNCPVAAIEVNPASPTTCTGFLAAPWPNLVANTVTLCGGIPPTTVTVNGTHNAASLFPYGTTTVYFTAQDVAGNSGACSFKVIVRDPVGELTVTNPTYTQTTTLPNYTFSNGGGFSVDDNGGNDCGRIVTWTGKPTVTNSQHPCAGPYTVTTVPASGSFFAVGSTLVNFIATDSKANTYNVGSFVVTVNDNFPVITCPQTSITVNAPANTCDALVTIPNATATDNCPGTVIYVSYGFGYGVQPATPQPVLFPSTYLPGYVNSPTTVTYLAQDNNGFQATCSVNVYVKDITKPILLSCPVSVSITDIPFDGTCGEPYTWTHPLLSDACLATLDSISVVVKHPDFADVSLYSYTGTPFSAAGNPETFAFNEGTSTVLYTATDLAGKIGTCSFTVKVTDNDAPNIFCPLVPIVTSTEALCRDSVELGLYDDGTNAISIDPVSGLCGTPRINYRLPNTLTNLPPSTTFPVGTHTLWAIVTDRSGNTNTCEFQIQVADQNPPAMSNCPTDIVIDDIDGGCGQNVTWSGPTFVDDCTASNALTITRSHTSGSFFASTGLPVQVIISAQDAAGNFSAGCTFNVTVNDKTKPSYGTTGCPANIVKNISNTDPSVCGADVNWTLSTTDDCGFYTIWFHDATTITYSGGFVITNQTPTALDVDFTAFFPTGTTVLTYRAEDNVGNTAFCTFSVTVNDKQGPSIIDCPGNVTVNTSGCASTPVSWTAPSYGGDNCGTGSLSGASIASGSSFAPGTSTVSYTATDNLGNTRVCSFTILVREGTPPVFSNISELPNFQPPPCGAAPYSDVYISASDCFGNGVLSSLTQLTAPAATDNCAPTNPTVTLRDPSTLLPFVLPINISPVGQIVEWIATDASGNTTVCSQTVYAKDTEKPVVVCSNFSIAVDVPGNTFIPITSSNFATALNNNLPVTTDNCASFFSPQYLFGNPNVQNFPLQFPVGATSVIWQATDGSGNTGTCIQIITVTGGTACTPTTPTFSGASNCGSVTPFALPTANCPASVTVTAAQLGLSATDNCGNALIIADKTITANATGTQTVTFTATAGANTVNCVRTVSVTCSNVPCTPTTPTFSQASNCGSATPFVLPDANCPASVTITAAQLSLGATDNCGTALVIPNKTITVNATGTQTVTFTATVGVNVASCSRVVSVTCTSIPPQNGCWDELVSLTANDQAAGKRYGISVAIDGDYAVVGANQDNSNRGAVYVLHKQGGTWVEVKKITLGAAATTSDYFGESVAISGNDIIVGARRKNSLKGAGYIFSKDQPGVNQWGLVATLTPATLPAGAEFGYSVDIDGVYAIVGARRDKNGVVVTGSAYFFKRTGAASWSQLGGARYATGGAASDYFGCSVSISGSYAVVGAYGVGTSDQGRAYLLYQGVSESWTQVGAAILPTGADAAGRFGFSVSIDGSNFVVGANNQQNAFADATGGAYVFQLDSPPLYWSEVQKIEPSNGNTGDLFGSTVSIFGDYIAVGSGNSTVSASGSSETVYVYQYDGTDWNTEQIVTDVNGSSGDYFGIDVAIDDATLAVGSFRDNVGANTGQGTVHFYNVCPIIVIRPSDRSAEKISDAASGTVRCFPNPFSDVLNIELAMEQEENVTVSICDASGREITTIFNDKTNGISNLQWNSLGYADGMYFVRVTSAGLRKVMPVIVLRERP